MGLLFFISHNNQRNRKNKKQGKTFLGSPDNQPGRAEKEQSPPGRESRPLQPVKALIFA
ncbi:MAG TPA: hypothetical protein VMR98_01325 [Candidatus Polarisedimenticolaceae bacterium]|nr:hypothetical protein [Candidatus Polarisedimenticolaceae bacterium]